MTFLVIFFLNLLFTMNVSISGLEHMSNLEEFWANSNQIGNFKEVEKLAPNSGLLTVYFENNPIQKDPQYRRKIKLVLAINRNISTALKQLIFKML